MCSGCEWKICFVALISEIMLDNFLFPDLNPRTSKLQFFRVVSGKKIRALSTGLICRHQNQFYM